MKHLFPEIFSEELESTMVYWNRVVEDHNFWCLLLQGKEGSGQNYFFQTLLSRIHAQSSLFLPFYPGRSQGPGPFLRTLQGDGIFRKPLSISLESLPHSFLDASSFLSQSSSRLAEILQKFPSPSLMYISDFQHADLALASHLARLMESKTKAGVLMIIHFLQEGKAPQTIQLLQEKGLPKISIQPPSEKKILSLLENFFPSLSSVLVKKLARNILHTVGDRIESLVWILRFLSEKPHLLEQFLRPREIPWSKWNILSDKEKNFLQMMALLFHKTLLPWQILENLPSLSSLHSYWGISEREILKMKEDFQEFLNPTELEKIYQTIPAHLLARDHEKGGEFFSQIFSPSKRPFEVEWQIALQYEKAENLENAGKTYLRAGIEYPLSATPQESVELIEKAVSAFERVENKRLLSEAMVELGWAYYRVGRPDEALKNLQNSRLFLRGLKASNLNELEERALIGEAEVFTHLLNDYEKGAARCQEVLEKKGGTYLPWAKIVRGYGLFKRRQVLSAEEMIRKGIAEAREQGLREAVFEGLLYLGSLLRGKSNKSDLWEAESCLKEALQSTNPFLISKVLDGLGRLYSATLKSKEALRFFTMSIALKLDLGDLSGAALSLGGKGQALFRKGVFPESVQCFLRDLEILSRQKNVPASDYASVHCYISDALCFLGDFEKALSYLKEARQIQESIPDFETRNQILGWILVSEGNIHLSLAKNLKAGSLREDKLVQARKLLEEALPRTSNSSLEWEAKLLEVRILALESKSKEAQEILEKIFEDPQAPYLNPYQLAWMHYEYGLLLSPPSSEKHFAIAYEIARKYENNWLMEQILRSNDGQVPLGGMEIFILYGEDEIVSLGEEWSMKICLYDIQSQPQSDVPLQLQILKEGKQVFSHSLSTGLDGTAQIPFIPKETGKYRVEIDAEGRGKKFFSFDVNQQKIQHDPSLSVSYSEKVILRKLFPEYPSIEIVEEVGGGLGGSRLLIVQPLTESGRKGAWVICKIGRQSFIEGEREGGFVFRKFHNLHAATVLENHCPSCRGKAGIKYVFLSPFGKEKAIIPLEDWFFKSDRISEFLTHTCEDILKPHFYSQYRLKNISAHWEYGRHYPENVRLSVEMPPEGIYEGSPPSLEGYVSIPLRKILEDEERIPLGTKVILEGLRVEKITWLPEKEWNKVDILLRDSDKTGIWVKVSCRLLSLLRLGMDPREPARGLMSAVGTIVSHRKNLIKEGVEKVMASFQDPQIYLSSEGMHIHQQTYPNPLSIYSELLHQKSLSRLCPIHGDLTVRNIMVDIFEQPWFIDFEYSQEEGHVLKDFIKLETSVRTFIVSRFLDQIKFPEEYILFEESLLRPQHSFRSRHKEMEKARKMILSIREIALSHLAVRNSWKEYYRCLFLYNLGLLKYTAPEELSARRLNWITASVLSQALRNRDEKEE